MWGEGLSLHSTFRIRNFYVFSAKAVVHRGHHPRWDKNINVVNIPGNVGPFWFELSRDAANLSIYGFGVGLVAIKGCCDLETRGRALGTSIPSAT